MKTQDTNNQETSDGLAKYTDSNLQALQDEKLSQEEWVERSWDFLTTITEAIERLPEEMQKRILELGRALASVGASYIHDDKKPRRPSISPAKAAAMNELKAKASGTAK